MKYYSVAELDITDRTWVATYVENVTRLVEEQGGRYLARTSNVEKLEGERQAPQIFLLIEWPSKEAAEAFYESEEYRPYRQSRREGARNEVLLPLGAAPGGVAAAHRFRQPAAAYLPAAIGSHVGGGRGHGR